VLERPSLAEQLRQKRSETVISELESTALRLFEERGFGEVTVQEIADEARISVRTFYRYFPTKEDVLQRRLDQRSDALRAALAHRPVEETPLHALRAALAEVVSAEDAVLLRRWISVVATTPSLLRAVIGGIHLKTLRVIAEFFGARLGTSSDDLIPTVLAAATGGVLQAAHTQWFLHGGDLSTKISECLEVLERGVPSVVDDWLPTVVEGVSS